MESGREPRYGRKGTIVQMALQEIWATARNLLASRRLRPMSGCGGFRVRRATGKPRLLGEIQRSQANRALIFNRPENDLPLFRFPGIDAGGFVTDRVVEKQKTIPFQGEGGDALPP